MTEAKPRPPRRLSFMDCLGIQFRVIGAVLMRELHTRYGRDNIGYLWVFAEPMMLGTVISIMHSGGSDNGINPVAFTVTGYCNFIMFRGIFNRSEGSLHANLPLLYHKMVTVLDITLARAFLEAAGTTVAFALLFSFCIAVGYAELPVRPLYMFMGIGYIFWWSLSLGMIVVGYSHDNSLLERLVHPFAYFMIPLSGAFYEASWIPQPYRYYLMFIPFPHFFEILRYGVFQDGTLEYVDFGYVTAICAGLTFVGLVGLRSVRRRLHLQ